MTNKKTPITGNQDKFKRQTKLLNIIETSKESYYDQESLALELNRAGFGSVNQAVVSRDMKELGIVKDKDGYRLSEPSSRSLARKELAEQLQRRKENIYPSISTFLIKIKHGYAQNIATLLKEVYSDEILGTICNDDSILVMTKEELKENLLRRLEKLSQPESE
ncbi:Arginine repressor [Sporomusa acidovorans DSM 3132]|uniref:Arginine repressor n=2 Tax=Sporomusa TaxID=2375 RepID=A0ABZ3J699_SPOA4|nr:arginine repressor [Sporomusa acidovorans DSM 3132]SDF81137.1 transcriptional regulator, ArgR family [Sporomusa acidovorans]